MPLGMPGYLCANHGPRNVFIVHSLTREVRFGHAERRQPRQERLGGSCGMLCVLMCGLPGSCLPPLPPIIFTESNTFPCKSESIWCVRSRLKKILKGRALSCNRTRSAPCAQRSTARGARPRREVAMHACKAPLAAPFRLGTAPSRWELTSGMSNRKCGES